MDLYKVLCLLFLLITIEGKPYQKDDGKKPFELNEFLQGTFSPRSFNGTWLTGNTIIYKNSDGDSFIYNVNTKSSTQFLQKNVLDGYPGAAVSISPDELYVLIRYNVSAVFRHSTTALYTIYDIENKSYHDIADNNQVQIVKWAPDGHSLVYVYLNNIYYLKDPSENPIQITTDGIPGILYNGVPDWVYEEEVLGTNSALWLSPDGKRIAFASFNDTNVREFDYFTYGRPGDLNDLYPTVIKIRYPKVGSANPTVTTFIADLEDGAKIVEIDAIPKRFLPEDYVLYGMTWVSNEEIAVTSTNRVQNESGLVRCHIDGSCKEEASYKEEKGWLDAKTPIYNKAGTHRLEILSRPESNDFYNHIVITEVATNISKQLTKGRFVVISVYGWDEINNHVYFLGSRENQPSQQHVYVVDTETVESKCLTCEMTTSEGPCKYASASFNKDFSYFIKTCQGPGPYLVQIQNTKNSDDVVVWEDNHVLIDKLATKLKPIVTDLKVPVDGGFEANVRLLLPPNFNETRKYPAIVNVYAGPDSNQISDRYSLSGFQNYIVTNREYIYIYIDGRGSGKDGKNKMFQIYRQLATVEIEDQIVVTKYLQENFPYIDANNTGIWGWSYGGFATAWVLVQDTENVFKFGLSVAPVTNFIYYDSIYTERYMGLPTPDDNLGGYNNTDLARNVQSFRGKIFFIIHGNADDNVHYQQSMLLSRALELADIPFRQQSYPDENHSLGRVYPHLYHTIDRFWSQCFGLPNPPVKKFTIKIKKP